MRTATDSATGEGFALAAAERAELAKCLEQGIQSARRSGGRTLVALTVRRSPELDPSAVAFASRRPGEPWFCFEQPERDRSSIAALGAVATVEDRGPQRFERVAAAWRVLVSDAVAEAPEGPPGAGLIATGGFAFADGGGASPPWSAFAPASLAVPELSFARSGDELRMTVTALATPDDLAEQLLERLERRLAELHAPALGLLDPLPSAGARIAAPMAPEHYVAAVARAAEIVASGELQKIVLAREVDVHAPQPHDAGAVFAALRQEFSGCFVFCVGRGESALIAASPELLVRREGQRASTIALAGSTRRSADPAVDEHLGEQLLRSPKEREEHAIVARRIEQVLRAHSVWVTMPPEPSLVRIANIQHLASPVRAQLAAPLAAVELAGLLHPTPAVGGLPGERAEALIPALEGIDRGWYAGPVGWTDSNEDGEFAVALRCALLDGALARCYAGVGVLADSDPQAELAETELKLQALLPLLAG